MGRSKTCEVERFSNSVGTSQWKLGEIAFSPEWTYFKINSGEMGGLKASLSLSLFLVSSFIKANIVDVSCAAYLTDMKEFDSHIHPLCVLGVFSQTW